MTLILDPDCFNLDPTHPLCRRVARALRYAGVLCVWAGLFLIRPRLALEVFAERRPNSPLRRRG